MRIVFFDGYCSLCSTLVDWLIRIDKTNKLKFASLQGETATRLLGSHSESIDVNTVIYLRENEKHKRSTAVLWILYDVGGVWVLTKIFMLIPKSIRDLVYTLIANNRFRFMKRRDTCRIPSPDERARLLP